MNDVTTRLLPIAVLLALGACSKQESAPQPTGPAPPATAPANEPAAAPAAETPATAPLLAAEETAETAPTETITETEDAAQTAEPASSGVRPSLRLGSIAPSDAPSERFKEGTHYRRLVPAQPTSLGPDKIEVVEAFWYGCNHCYSLEPALEAWNATKPHYVELVRLPSMGSETARMHARLFYTIEALGKVDPLHAQVLREIHVNGNPLNTLERITAFMNEHGIDAQEFNEVFSSFAVESRLQRADFLNRRYHIASVPTFIVNGKYTTDVGEAGGEPQLFALLGDLTAHEHGG